MPSQASEVLDFLSKFLPLTDDWSNDWKLLKEEITKLEERLILPSAYPNKESFRSKFDFFLKRLFFYARFPWLGGKCLIARIGYADPFSTRHDLPAIKSIPILYAAQVKTTLYNPQGSALDYPKAKIPDILSAIRDSDGNVDALFSLIAIRDVTLPPQTVLVDVPSLCQPDNIFFKPLLAAAEQIKLFPSSSLAPSTVAFLESRRPRFPVFWVQDAQEEFLIRLPRKSDESQPNCRCGGYIPFWFLCECFFSAPTAWNHLQRARLEFQKSRLGEDKILDDADQKLNEIRDRLRKTLTSSLDALDTWRKAYEDAAKEIVTMAAGMDDRIVAISKVDPLKGMACQHNNDWTVAENHLLDLITTKKRIELRKFASLIEENGYPHHGILVSAQAALDDDSPNASSDTIIDASIAGMDTMLAHVLCVLLRKKMNIPLPEAGRKHALPLVKEAPEIADRLPELYFAAGTALCHEGKAEDGMKLLCKALTNGYEEAVYDFVRKNGDKKAIQSEKVIRFLAENLVPEACFDLALADGRAPTYGKRLFYLYAAAARRHVGALRVLARVEREESFNKDLSEDIRGVHRRHAVGLYRILEEMHETLSSTELCDLGCMLHGEKKYQAAFKYLSESTEAHAFYMLGRMYHYGDGVAMDAEKARKYYTRAVELGDNGASKLLAALDERAQAEAKTWQGTYSRKEERVSSSTSSDGSFCFLTTAACRARGLPDDCAVLTAYRRFRDEVLLPTEEGKALVEEYYRIAPDIVRAIENRADSEEIYAAMWDNFLAPGYRLVLEKKHIAAKELYIQLVLWIIKKVYQERTVSNL